MTNFYYFTHRLVRRMSYCCRVSLQSEYGSCILEPWWGVPSYYSGLRGLIVRIMHPIDFSILSAKVTSSGIQIDALTRQNYSKPRETPVHIFVRRYEHDSV